jgi:hypothetical protein
MNARARVHPAWLMSFYPLLAALIVMYALILLPSCLVSLPVFCSQFTSPHTELTLHHYNHCPEIILR